MPLAYQLSYNEDVVKRGEAYNKAVLPYLDGHFKEYVTKALEELLQQRPEDPIRFLATKMRESKQNDQLNKVKKRTSSVSKAERRASYAPVAAAEETQRLMKEDLTSDKTDTAEIQRDGQSQYVLRFDGGVTCEVKSLADESTPTVSPPSVPLLKLVCPTVYDVLSAVSNLDARAPLNSGTSARSPLLIIVELPMLPNNVIYIQGIPYIEDLAHQLQLHRRQGNTAAPLPQDGETFSGKAHRLLVDKLGSGVQSLHEALCALGSTSADPPVEGLLGEETHVVLLPQVQQNFLSTFDCIDQAFRSCMRPKVPSNGGHDLVSGTSTSTTEFTYTECPSVLFLSYRKDTAALTHARILSSLIPYFEKAQFRKMDSLRQQSQASKNGLSMEFYADYWREVQHRREERDEKRRTRRIVKRVPPSVDGKRTAKESTDTFPDGGVVHRTKSKALLFATVETHDGTVSTRSLDEVPSSPSPHNPRQAEHRQELAQKRALRRQSEDTAFLEAIHVLKVQAATQIQAFYRGYRIRCCVKSMSLFKCDNQGRQNKAIHTLRMPSTLPPLLRFCFKRLSSVHGELFGNYAATLLADPRRSSLFKPVRRTLSPEQSDDDVPSETEDFKETVFITFPSRCSRPPPHVNPLRRLLEYHRLSGCTLLDDALVIQHQCSGLSHLQRRSYDMLKSVCLDLLHIAYTELYHRGLLLPEFASFSAFVIQYHADLLKCFAQPHIATRSFRLQERICEAREMLTPLVELQTVNAIFDEEVLSKERFLVSGTGGGAQPTNASTDTSSGNTVRTYSLDKQFQATSKTVRCRSVAPHVYVAPSFLLAKEWSATLTSLVTAETRLCEKKMREAKNPENRASVPLVKVLWWTLCPHPAVYVYGRPYVLIPRQNHQVLEGRPSYDEFVLRMRKSDEAQESGRSGSSSGSDLMKTGSLANRPSSLHDGAVTPALTSVPPDDTVEPAPPSPAEDANLSELFGVSIMNEEEYLKSMLVHCMAKDGCVCYYEPKAAPNGVAACETNARASAACREVDKCSYVTAMKAGYFASIKLMRDKCEAEENNNQRSKTSSRTGLSRTRSFRQRSDYRGDSWGRVLNTLSMYMSSRNIGDSKPSTRRNSRDTKAFPDVKPIAASKTSGDLLSSPWKDSSGQCSPTSQTTRISERLPARIKTSGEVVTWMNTQISGATVTHVRPWLTPMPADEWLKRCDMFIEACAGQLWSDSVIVFAYDDPLQRIYVCMAAMISKAMAQLKEDELDKGDAVNRVAKSVYFCSDSALPALSPTHVDKLRFLSGFETGILEATMSLGVNPSVCTDAAVETFSVLSGGKHILAEVCADICTAEHAVNGKECHDAILRAIRMVEQYCWLVLVQVYLSLSFTKQALVHHGSKQLPSFATLVKSMRILPWMEAIDPWVMCPEQSPDTAHLRYSNGLRRWDNTDYICFGGV